MFIWLLLSRFELFMLYNVKSQNFSNAFHATSNIFPLWLVVSQPLKIPIIYSEKLAKSWFRVGMSPSFNSPMKFESETTKNQQVRADSRLRPIPKKNTNINLVTFFMETSEIAVEIISIISNSLRQLQPFLWKTRMVWTVWR